MTDLDRLYRLRDLLRVESTANYSHTYFPRGACRQVVDDQGDEVLIVGPAGTGKSRACLEKLHSLALAHPGMRGLMIRKTQTSLTSSGLVTWKRDVIPESEQAGTVKFYGGSAEHPAQYQYENKSVVVVGGMDKASKVLSTEYDMVFVQEATELSENDWEHLTSRLRSGVMPFQQLIADCNPAQETHWLKQRCDRGQTKMLFSRHEDNPLLFDEDGEITEFGKDYIARLDRLTGVRYLRLRKGEWASAEGVVYEEWDSAVHLIDRFDIPPSWSRYLAVDFGYTNPFVCQWWAEDHDGRLYLYREIYHTQRLVEDHAAQILRYLREESVKAIVCDHDAEGRATLERKLGRSTLGALKNVSTGIQAVQSRLNPAGDGKPRLYVLHDSVVEVDLELLEAGRPTSTEQEIGGYVWDIRESRPPKEEPVKEDDHGMDAMRYMVMYRQSPRKIKAGSASVRVSDQVG